MRVNAKYLVIATASGGLAAAALWGAFLRGGEAQVEALVVADGTVVAASASAEQAVNDASRRVGFEVRIPASVPAHLKLRTIRTDLGGPGETNFSSSWSHAAALLYEDGQGHHISISQTPPERSVKLAAGSHPREIDLGDAKVAVMVSDERSDAVSVAWDSPQETYFAIYVFPPETLSHAEAEQVLLAMLGSME